MEIIRATQEICNRAREVREKAHASVYWKLNIEALLESNNLIFQGPISYQDMEECYNRVLDEYDPNILEYWETDTESYDGNPFWSLVELENGEVSNVMLWETQDVESIATYLSQKYKWRK